MCSECNIAAQSRVNNVEIGGESIENSSHGHCVHPSQRCPQNCITEPVEQLPRSANRTSEDVEEAKRA